MMYTITAIKAIADSANDTEIQEAVLVHLNKDSFNDGDCILFGYSAEDFECDNDITEALNNDTPSSDYTIDDNGIYHCN